MTTNYRASEIESPLTLAAWFVLCAAGGMALSESRFGAGVAINLDLKPEGGRGPGFKSRRYRRFGRDES